MTGIIPPLVISNLYGGPVMGMLCKIVRDPTGFVGTSYHFGIIMEGKKLSSVFFLPRTLWDPSQFCTTCPSLWRTTQPILTYEYTSRKGSQTAYTSLVNRGPKDRTVPDVMTQHIPVDLPAPLVPFPPMSDTFQHL